MRVGRVTPCAPVLADGHHRISGGQRTARPTHPCLSVSIRGERPLPFGGFGAVFQNLAGLTLQMFANGFECGEADGPGLAGLEDG